MITAIIVDDEMMAIKGLDLELRNFSDRIEICGKFTSAQNALDFIQNNSVDVVFLDVEMPGVTGFDFLDKFQERNFHVVFTTAYSKYALNAIKNEAVYYLLKPVDIDELENCINRLEKVLQKDSFDTKLEDALNKLNEMGAGPRKIKLAYDGKIAFLDPADIVYFEGSGNYTSVFVKDGSKILLTRQLKQVENDLPEGVFFRIHKSYIVNLTKVSAYLKSEGMLMLDNEVSLPVSLQKRGEILTRL